MAKVRLMARVRVMTRFMTGELGPEHSMVAWPLGHAIRGQRYWRPTHLDAAEALCTLGSQSLGAKTLCAVGSSDTGLMEMRLGKFPTKQSLGTQQLISPQSAWLTFSSSYLMARVE